MCSPDPATMMMALSIASTVAGTITQSNAVDSQNASNATQAKNLKTTQAQNFNQINLERQQASDQAGQKISENNNSQREAQATTIARAGPSGLSVDNLLANMGSKGAGYNESVNENLDRTNMALDNQLENVNNQTASSMNQLKTPNQVDYLGSALKIGTAYQTYKAS